MPIDRLREDLQRLREEIAHADNTDPDAVARLAQLAERIEREIKEERVLGDPGRLITEIEESLGAFEASHPNLSAILNNMLLILGSMGV